MHFPCFYFYISDFLPLAFSLSSCCASYTKGPRWDQAGALGIEAQVCRCIQLNHFFVLQSVTEGTLISDFLGGNQPLSATQPDIPFAFLLCKTPHHQQTNMSGFHIAANTAEDECTPLHESSTGYKSKHQELRRKLFCVTGQSAVTLCAQTLGGDPNRTSPV